jgi:hypothetical protein
MSDLQDIIATNTIRAFNSGIQHERQRILTMLEAEIKKFEDKPEELDTFEATGVYLGLKRAHLHVKELKWT